MLCAGLYRLEAVALGNFYVQNPEAKAVMKPPGKNATHYFNTHQAACAEMGVCWVSDGKYSYITVQATLPTSVEAVVPPLSTSTAAGALPSLAVRDSFLSSSYAPIASFETQDTKWSPAVSTNVHNTWGAGMDTTWNAFGHIGQPLLKAEQKQEATLFLDLERQLQKELDQQPRQRIQEAQYHQATHTPQTLTQPLFLSTSKVLSSECGWQRIQILKWLQEDAIPVTTFRLLYSAAIHGWGSTDFHRCCDGQGPTLVVAQAVEAHNDTPHALLGGFTSVSWEGPYTQRLQPDPCSFLFSFGSSWHKKYPLDSSTGVPQGTVVHSADYGPSFGGAFSMHICNEPNTEEKSYHDMGVSKTNKQFRLSTFEVWALR